MNNADQNDDGMKEVERVRRQVEAVRERIRLINAAGSEHESQSAAARY